MGRKPPNKSEQNPRIYVNNICHSINEIKKKLIGHIAQAFPNKVHAEKRYHYYRSLVQEQKFKELKLDSFLEANAAYIWFCLNFFCQQCS